MSRIKRGGYIIEWWMGDHPPRHVHVFRDGKEIAKVKVPSLGLLSGKMNRKLRKILMKLMEEKIL